MPRKVPKKASTKELQAKIVGQVEMVDLEKVKPNTWNPNAMTPFQKESLKNGFQTDGWLTSQSLLVWGSDEKGRPKNIIIDGEHRHAVARELKMKQGPMVFLHRIPERKARELTIKMDAKRGTFDSDRLGLVVRSIQESYEGDMTAMGLALGFETETLLMHLSDPNEIVVEEPANGGIIGNLPSGQSANVRMVQLFFTHEQHEEFSGISKELAVRFGTTNLTDTVMAAVKHAAASKK